MDSAEEVIARMPVMRMAPVQGDLGLALAVFVFRKSMTAVKVGLGFAYVLVVVNLGDGRVGRSADHLRRGPVPQGADGARKSKAAGIPLTQP